MSGRPARGARHGDDPAPSGHPGTPSRGPGQADDDRRPRDLVDARRHRRPGRRVASCSSSSAAPIRDGRAEVVEVDRAIASSGACVGGPDEWVGGDDHVRRSSRPADETVLKFTQTWREPVDFMFHCSTKWGVLPARPEGVARGRQGHAVPRRSADQQLGLIATERRHGRGLQSAGRSESAPHARQPERARRPEPHGAVRGPRHGAPVGEQAPRGAGGREPRDHRSARSREVALPQRRAHQRDRTALDQPVRPRAHPGARRPESMPWRAPQWRTSSSSTRPTSTPRPSWCGRASPTPRSPSGTGASSSRPTGRSAPRSPGSTTASPSPIPSSVVLESDPFRRLSYTWHSFTPEWAKVIGIDDAAPRPRSRPSRGRRRRSRSSPIDDICKLTVVHEFFDADSIVVDDGQPGLAARARPS